MTDTIYLNWIIAGGHYNHKNHASEYAKKFGKFGVADMREKPSQENYASEGEMNGCDTVQNFGATFTNTGCPISQLKKNQPVASYIQLGSNKHNACPLVIGRVKGKYVLWHISYQNMMRVIEQKQNMRVLFPTFFTKVHEELPQFSLMSIFDDPDAEFLVTNDALLSNDVLGVHASAKISKLPLPIGLTIVSCGLESSVRSYSVAYYFDGVDGVDGDDEKLVLSGETDGHDSLWMMTNPFNKEKEWSFLGKAADLL